MGTNRCDSRTVPKKLYIRRGYSRASLEKLGTSGVLAMIHDAIAHIITPIHKMPDLLPILERIAKALERIAEDDKLRLVPVRAIRSSRVRRKN